MLVDTLATAPYPHVQIVMPTNFFFSPISYHSKLDKVSYDTTTDTMNIWIWDETLNLYTPEYSWKMIFRKKYSINIPSKFTPVYCIHQLPRVKPNPNFILRYPPEYFSRPIYWDSQLMGNANLVPGNLELLNLAIDADRRPSTLTSKSQEWYGTNHIN